MTGFFTCYCGNTGWNGYRNKSQHRKSTWRRKFSRRSSRDSNPRPFNHESGALTTELSPPPNRGLMMMSWCLMSSDVIWHIRDKLWPMPKHGSIKSTYVRCMRVLAVTCHLHFWQNDRDFLRANCGNTGVERITTVARKKSGHSAKSAGGRLQLNTHTPYVCGFYWTVLRHWSQLVPNMSNDIWGH